MFKIILERLTYAAGPHLSYYPEHAQLVAWGIAGHYKTVLGASGILNRKCDFIPEIAVRVWRV